MNKRRIKIIPPKDDRAINRYQQTPGRLRVLTYALLTKGGRIEVQIRKDVRRLIADHADWQFIEVCTDYCDMEDNQKMWKNFLRILTMVKHRYIDVLIIYSENAHESLFSTANFINEYCSHFGVDLYIANNNQLLTIKSNDDYKQSC